MQLAIHHFLSKILKKILTCQRGLTLVEILVSIVLLLIVFSCMVNLFSQSLSIWTIEKNGIQMEQTARIAVDTIMREIRYSQKINLTSTGVLTITKLSGETNTFQLGSGFHSHTLYIIIDKRNVTPAGGMSTNPITENIVTNLSFAPYPELTNIQAILITLEVMDQKNNKKYTIQTAGYPWNCDKTLLY